MNKGFKEYLEENSYLFTGRATTGFYLILKANKIKNMGVLVPANICYAAVLAVIYSGNRPIFVDVSLDGNINYKILQTTVFKNIAVAIIPHMFGNPCIDISKISLYLKKRGILLIEDCALAMGAEINRQMVGDFGDYAVFSFGYSKTIDLGYGGLIVTKNDLTQIQKVNNRFNYYDTGIGEKLKLISELYRVIRNNNETDFAKYIFKYFTKYYKNCFLFRSTREHDQDIIKQVESLNKIIEERRDNVKFYEQELNYNNNIEIYKFNNGAVPWRFNLLIEEKYKKPLIKYLLANNIPVSDWYPTVAPIFGVHVPFLNAQAIEKKILNFPLMGLDRFKISSITDVINEFWKKEI